MELFGVYYARYDMRLGQSTFAKTVMYRFFGESVHRREDETEDCVRRTPHFVLRRPEGLPCKGLGGQRWPKS